MIVEAQDLAGVATDTTQVLSAGSVEFPPGTRLYRAGPREVGGRKRVRLVLHVPSIGREPRSTIDMLLEREAQVRLRG